VPRWVPSVIGYLDWCGPALGAPLLTDSLDLGCGILPIGQSRSRTCSQELVRLEATLSIDSRGSPGLVISPRS
jgi:hypothetical protein